MGYDIKVICKNKRSYERMKTFLAQEYRPWSELDPTRQADEDYVSLHFDEAVGIEFHYNSAAPEREYPFGILRFVALHVGETKRLDVLDGALAPYIQYEGSEDIPVLLNAAWSRKLEKMGKSRDIQVCDYTGFFSLYDRAVRRFEEQGMEPGPRERMDAIRRNDELIMTELQRLSEAWVRYAQEQEAT